MANQEYSDNKQASEAESAEETTIEPTSSNVSSEIAEELDQILDEIDSVLESNAEEFVKSYVQKGGQQRTGNRSRYDYPVTLPRFTPENDPGPDFSALIDKFGVPSISNSHEIIENLPHGTTCVAIKYTDGVVLAGDRRATSGHHISFRTMEKVFQSDTFSGVAISGAAGPAIEMVKLFQLQLEHYEKVEGNALSLDCLLYTSPSPRDS